VRLQIRKEGTRQGADDDEERGAAEKGWKEGRCVVFLEG